MTTAKIDVICNRCNGTGIDENLTPPGPCPGCSGDGWKEGNTMKLDTTDIMAELDYIHGKVTAIWNAVKPPA